MKSASAAGLLLALALAGCESPMLGMLKDEIKMETDAKGNPAIHLSSSGPLNFVAPVGGADADPLFVDVTNSGGGSLSFLGAEVTYEDGSGWLEARLDQAAAPARLRLSPRVQGLAEGEYHATAYVTSPIASPMRVPVSVILSVTDMAIIELDASSLSFEAGADGDWPEIQVLSVTNAGNMDLTELSCSVSYPGTSGWLVTALDSSTTPASLSLRPNLTSLPPGTYTATLTFDGTGTFNKPTVTVTYVVSDKPLISLSHASLSYAAVEGGPNPESQQVAISNTGAGTLSGLALSFDYTTDSGWLQAQLDSTTAPATLTLTPLTGELTPGTYTATVSVSSDVAANSPEEILVSFAVASLPHISLSGASLGFATGTGRDPDPQGLTLTNGGGWPLSGLAASVSYASGSGWLDATLGSATLAPSASTTLTLTPTAGGMGPGTYQATVTIGAALADNSPQAVTVDLTINDEPSIGLSPASLAFNAVTGQADPSPQTVSVTNDGTGSVSGLSASIDTTGDGWLDVAFDTTTAPATLTATAHTDGVAAGIYTATITLTSTSATNSPQTIGVSFTVSDPPHISMDPSSLDFAAFTAKNDPASQPVNVSNSGDLPLTGLQASIGYTSGSGWLSASIDRDYAPAVLTLGCATTGLAGGVYQATITVSSAAADNSPQTVPVTFTVIDEPALQVSASSLEFDAIETLADPDAKTVDLTNGGTGTLSDITVAVSYASGSGWLQATLDATTAPAILTVAPDVSGLAPGTYGATVTIDSSVAVNEPQTIGVSFEVRHNAGDGAIVVVGGMPGDIAFEVSVETTSGSPSVDTSGTYAMWTFSKSQLPATVNLGTTPSADTVEWYMDGTLVTGTTSSLAVTEALLRSGGQGLVQPHYVTMKATAGTDICSATIILKVTD